MDIIRYRVGIWYSTRQSSRSMLMRSWVTHSWVTQVMLIVVMLVHPVATFAAVCAPLGTADQSMPLHSTNTEAMGAMSAAGGQFASNHQPCHSPASNTNVPAGNCCHAVESAACLLSCYSVAGAISVSSANDAVINPITAQFGAFNSYLFQSLSGIFHPPRIG